MPGPALQFANFPEAILAARRALREGRYDVATAICDYVLAAGREADAAHLVRARVHLARREFDRAAACVEAVAPTPELYDVRAELYAAQGRFDLAAQQLDTYAATAPPALDLVRRRARHAMLAGRPSQAIDLVLAALPHFPGEASLYDLLAEICLRARRWSDTVRWARASLQLQPGNPRRQLSLLDAAARLVDFESIRSHAAGLLGTLGQSGDARTIRALTAAADLRPMHAALYFGSDAVTRAAAEHAAASLGRPPAVALLARPALKARKLRIGYLSGDFNDHPVMQLMRGFFAAHDTEDHDVRLFSYGPDDASRYRRELRERFPGFVDLAALDDAAAAAAIAEAGLDVLVDLKGWNRGTRMGIVARRPAPVLIGYLGFPGTYGGLVDHVIVDRMVVPESAAGHYAENLLFLPHCYLPADSGEALRAPPMRAAAGLRDDAFVLGAFNRALKVSEENLRAWMAILRAAPGAVLWLGSESAPERDNYRAFAAAEGIDPQRLVFAERAADKRDHLARLGLIDLALDTWRYNGHTSTVDMLLAGVPVLAKTGSHFASRVSESVLRAARLSEMLTASREDYVARAIAFATGRRDIAPVRAALAAARATAPLFDTAGFVRDFLALVAGTVR